MMTPRVSVLIPCYNAGRFLGAALNSVLAQTYQDFEIIVVDDGSTDQTAEVAAAYPCVRYIYSEHKGIPCARNLAVSHAKGEYIAFLDADDMWDTTKLEKQISYLDSHADCRIVYTLAKNFYDGDSASMTQRQNQLLHANMDHYLVSCCIARSVFEEYGGFSEDYPYGEDTHWVARICATGISMKHCIEEPLYLRRIHDSNISLTHKQVGRDSVMPLLVDAIRQARKGKKA